MAVHEPITAFLPTQPQVHNISLLPFPQAIEKWLETRKPYLSPATYHNYKLNMKPLCAFFGQVRLNEIDGDLIRAYQQMRLTQCGPYGINQECSVLQQMLKRAGRWPHIAWNYEPLPLPKEKRGRVLSPEERGRLLAAASSNPNWEAAYLFATISVNTTAGPKETATLRLTDVDLERRIITIQPEGAKNVHRIRPIPLNEESFRAAQLAIARAQRLGACAPHHFVFPFCIHRKLFDPTRHQTTFKTAWKKLRVAAGLSGLRMYDLRHHAITVLLENPSVSEETAETIAGHISRRIKKRYSHVRMEVMRAALSGMREQKYSTPPLANNDIVDMLSLGFSVDVVLAKIRSGPCGFDTSIEAMKQLKANAVPDPVIAAMIQGGKHARG